MKHSVIVNSMYFSIPVRLELSGTVWLYFIVYNTRIFGKKNWSILTELVFFLLPLFNALLLWPIICQGEGVLCPLNYGTALTWKLEFSVLHFVSISILKLTPVPVWPDCMSQLLPNLSIPLIITCQNHIKSTIKPQNVSFTTLLLKKMSRPYLVTLLRTSIRADRLSR